MDNMLPEEISIFFNEIANRLKQDHASVMIGAGFSKNAQPSNSCVKRFPSWNELGDVFMQKLKGKVEDGDRAYADVLKLADELETTFGKTYLNDLVKNEIPDQDYTPSPLHIDLLKLPWKDVFTTNYDTLLERATEQIVDKRFDVVINKHDLIWSKSPRIIKLHGSFPSTVPFILSGEDYRRYPIDYAPFVNTVQQSLLENTLCLFGFSGDDPNFLHWIGWVRDNLGSQNSPKIYLIGVLSLSYGQKKLLESRNIIPVDLSCLCSAETTNNRHYDALLLFVKSLRCYIKADNIEEWTDIAKIPCKEDKKVDYQELYNLWNKSHLKYPQWLILAEKKRNDILDIIDRVHLSIDTVNNFDVPYDLLFLYEFNWRIEVSLYPIMSDWFETYESTVDKYAPFGNSEIESAITPQSHPALNWSDLQVKWADIKLGLFRLYREDGYIDKWNTYYAELKELKQYFTKEQRARFGYECCLFHMCYFNNESLRTCLSEWEVDSSLPYWAAKKVVLQSSILGSDKAANMLEDLLSSVRKELNLSTETTNFANLSNEGYIMLLHRIIAIQNYFGMPNDDYSDRWKQIDKYGCSPWKEMDIFNSKMQYYDSFVQETTVTHSFDVGRTNTTRSSGKNRHAFRLAYSLFRFTEEVGISYSSLNNKTLGKAITVVANYSPNLAYSAMINSGVVEVVSLLFDRKSLFLKSYDDINKIGEQYIQSLSVLFQMSDLDRSTSVYRKMSATLPEVLSRLCCKLSYENRKSLLELIKANYELFIRNIYFQKSDGLISRLIKSFSKEEQYILIPTLIEFPVLDNKDEWKSEPFSHLKYLTEGKNIKVSATAISTLLNNLLVNSGIRYMSLIRLEYLYRSNLLNNSQTKRFAKNLWSITSNSGFPSLSHYHNFVYLKLPHPLEVDPANLLREYIRTTPFLIESKEESSGISIFGGNIPIYANIVGTNNCAESYQWSPEDLNKLASDITDWWHYDKHYLLDTESGFISIADEFKKRFSDVERIIGGVIAQNITIINDDLIGKIKAMVEDLPNYNISNFYLKAALASIFTDTEFNNKELILALCSNSEPQILSAINATIRRIENNIESLDLFKVICENFRCGKTEALRLTVGVVANTLNSQLIITDMDILRNIDLGLQYMFSSQKYETKDTNSDIQNKLEIRLRIAEIIAYLITGEFSYDYSNIIQKWEAEFNSNEEFTEVRNRFLNKLKDN